MQDMAEFICKSGTNGTALVFKKLLNVNMAVPFLNSVTKNCWLVLPNLFS